MKKLKIDIGFLGVEGNNSISPASDDENILGLYLVTTLNVM